jgi:hypothetical protein
VKRTISAIFFRFEENMTKKEAVIVVTLAIIAALCIAGCVSERKETQTSAVPAGSTTPQAAPAGQAGVSVSAQYQGLYTPTSEFTPTPKPGYQYVQVYATVKNLNDEGVGLGNPFSFTLFDTTNQGYSVSGVAFFANDLIKGISNSHPGDTTSGRLVFEVKQGATPQKLIYDDFTNKVTVTF